MALLALVMTRAVTQKPDVKRHVIPSPVGEEPFTLVHITDTHVGQGLPDRDYGSRGFMDSLTDKRGGYASDRLAFAIENINALLQGSHASLVILSGDITDSGEKSEFLHAGSLLAQLHAPWVPLMGNHDTWPYTRFGDEALSACGDSLMNHLFDKEFRRLGTLFRFHDDRRLTACYDPLSGRNAYLQNFAFTAHGWRFVFLDFNPRYHVRTTEPGIGPEVCLHTQPCGTLEFLRSQLEAASHAAEPVCLVSHHPPMTVNLMGKHYAFTRRQKKELLGILKTYRGTPRLWLCGHFHRRACYRLRGAGPLRVYETKANMRGKAGAYRVFSFAPNKL